MTISERFCTICQEKTHWKLDNRLKHSRCAKCGSNSSFSNTNRSNARFGHGRYRQRFIAASAEEKKYDPITSLFHFISFVERHIEIYNR
jgi:hypothetical protein